MTSEQSSPSLIGTLQTIAHTQGELPFGDLAASRQHLETAARIIGQVLEMHDAGHDVAVSLDAAQERSGRAAKALADTNQRLSWYAAALVGANQMDVRLGMAPLRAQEPISGREKPKPESQCLDLAADQMVFQGRLPDGRNAADALPDDGRPRQFEGSCPVSGCETVGTITCMGNRAIAYQGAGSCAQFQARLDQANNPLVNRERI